MVWIWHRNLADAVRESRGLVVDPRQVGAVVGTFGTALQVVCRRIVELELEQAGAVPDDIGGDEVVGSGIRSVLRGYIEPDCTHPHGGPPLLLQRGLRNALLRFTQSFDRVREDARTCGRHPLSTVMAPSTKQAAVEVPSG